jgi:hypothetical protein
MTMLTSVVQVLASTGAARGLASRSIGARRARARLPSVTLAATASHTILVAMAKSAGTVRRTRADMVAVPGALVTAAARKSQAMAVNKSLPVMVVRKSPTTEVAMVASKKAPDMAVKSLQATEATLAVMAEDGAMVVKSPSATTECPADSAATTSLASVDSAERVNAAATTTTMSTAAGRRAMVAVATERRAMVAGTRVYERGYCALRVSLLEYLDGVGS